MTITTTIRLEAPLVRAMQRMHALNGVQMSEQIRRALREWLTAKGVEINDDDDTMPPPMKKKTTTRSAKKRAHTTKQRKGKRR